MTVAVVVDSASQMPDDLARGLGATVVPVLVSVDGVEYREGVDLSADDFYAHWSDGRSPVVATSQPSPGDFVAAYSAVESSGVEEILSIHLTESMSGTLNSARIAAAEVDVPVRVVDSGTASFGISCCAWAAADALAGGATLDDAVEVAVRVGASLRTSFVVGVPDLLRRSGRAAGVEVGDGDGVPVLAMSGTDLVVIDTVTDVDAAVEAMAADALAWPSVRPDGRRIAVGRSDESSRAVADRLVERLRDADGVLDVVEYRIGPSIGAHTGPGTAGLFCF